VKSRTRLLFLLAVLLLALSMGSSVSFCRNPNKPGLSWQWIEEYNISRSTPRWSPDGGHIVAASEGAIISVRANGSRFRRLSGGEYVIYDAPDISPDGERMVYTTTRHRSAPWSLSAPWRNFEIETSRLNGSGKRRITKDPGQDVAPAWSPDGTRIAFVRHGSNAESPGIYTVAADGSDQQLVVPFRTGSGEEGDLAVYSWGKTGPTWSPNGEMLGYVLRIDNRVRNAQGGLETLRREVLYVVNADGTELKELFAVEDSLQESIATEPAWSPDSRRIAFVHQTQPTEGNRGMVKLYTVRPDGSELTQILGPDDGLGPFTVFIWENAVLSWSPDGTGVLISADASDGHLSVVDPDGSNRRRVGASGAVGIWSPDGSRIAQYRDADSRIYLSTVNPDGSDLRVLLWIDEEGNLKRAD
jgi:Tol biopolymer transport system component